MTEQIAQAASCLKPKLFKTALNTVKGALSAAAKAKEKAAAAAASPSKAARTVTYNALLGEKKIGRKGMVLGWMQDAERALMANREARRRFTSYDAVTVAVFCWTCQLMGVRITLCSVHGEAGVDAVTRVVGQEGRPGDAAGHLRCTWGPVQRDHGGAA